MKSYMSRSGNLSPLWRFCLLLQNEAAMSPNKAPNDNKKKTIKYLKETYFSLICKTPMRVKKLKAITGDHMARTKETLSVCPKAKERSLK